ncbi:unnamed protein product [Rotaria magnacalcarata]|uniref:Uncharacterized protein n=2 Tax=Rotaria magnacalcarata TaxID=392030 RepID=A0A816P679_9BILA|nr:unnamed protein product [Rotaria magnacalcarata]
MSTIGKKRRHPTTSSPNDSDEDNSEQLQNSASQLSNKRRGSVAADFAPHRLIFSERQQMAVLKQLTAGEESNPGSQSPSSITPQPRPSKINRRNEHGETIVHIAARKGDIKQLRKVLKAGANVNEGDNAGWTPLHEAVTKNQFKAARLLLKSGANANAPGPEGQTPIVDAVLNNNTMMVELLLNYSADPSAVDSTRLNETMLSIIKGETSVLDSSDNENDDESISSLSSLTSDEDCEQDDKQNFHSTLVEKLDKNLSQRSKFAKIQRKPLGRFRPRSSQSSDSSSYSKPRTASGNNETSSGKNPYDFDSEEDNEMRKSTNETRDENKKKTVRKQESLKKRANSGSSIPSSESLNIKKRSKKIDLFKEQQKFQSTSDDEQLQIYRVPPLKIVLARAVLHKTSDIESLNLSNMDNNNLTVDTSSMPIIEHSKKLLSSMSSSIPVTSSENTEKSQNIKEHENEDEILKLNRHRNSSHISNLEQAKRIPSSLSQSQSPQSIISTLLDKVITEIETTNDQQLNSLPIIEDDQMEVDDDDDDDNDENEDDDDDDKERSTAKTSSSSSSSSSSKRDLKPTTRTLRSHARAKVNSLTLIQSSSNTYNNVRRVSSRRRALEKKSLLSANENEKKRKSLSERSKKDKDNTATNDDIHTSSYSDDQTTENTNTEKLSHTVASQHDDASSCSSTGAGDGSSTSSSMTNNKQSNTNPDIDTLPPNKRRLRERNAVISNTSLPSSLTNDASNNSNSTTITDNSLTETITTREIPINSIKQFLEIRQQIDKRHETMLHEFVLPKVPKDFSDTTMAKKSYLIAPPSSSYSITTPASIGIKRLTSPLDLDTHLADVFTKQEDERYKMKLRHQVERDKLILSHEQEVLRLYGNATRSSVNQDTPLSYCSLLKDNEVYNNPSISLPEKFISNDCTNTELGKRGKHRWNGRSFIKWLEDSNLKYKRLSCELNERQRLEVDTLYSIQRMVWLKHLPKESANLSSSSSSGRTSCLLTERYLPKVEINLNFWTNWETSPF